MRHEIVGDRDAIKTRGGDELMSSAYPHFKPCYTHEELVEHFLLTPADLPGRCCKCSNGTPGGARTAVMFSNERGICSKFSQHSTKRIISEPAGAAARSLRRHDSSGRLPLRRRAQSDAGHSPPVLDAVGIPATEGARTISANLIRSLMQSCHTARSTIPL
jgi:hypothetical protein